MVQGEGQLISNISVSSEYLSAKNNLHAFDKAVQNAGIVDFRFHDLRHCAINNLRLAGNDHYNIKKVSGHKTDIAFQRYNLVTEEEILGMKWLDLKKDELRTMDTYMDTKVLQ